MNLRSYILCVFSIFFTLCSAMEQEQTAIALLKCSDPPFNLYPITQRHVEESRMLTSMFEDGKQDEPNTLPVISINCTAQQLKHRLKVLDPDVRQRPTSIEHALALLSAANHFGARSFDDYAASCAKKLYLNTFMLLGDYQSLTLIQKYPPELGYAIYKALIQQGCLKHPYVETEISTPSRADSVRFANRQHDLYISIPPTTTDTLHESSRTKQTLIHPLKKKPTSFHTIPIPVYPKSGYKVEQSDTNILTVRDKEKEVVFTKQLKSLCTVKSLSSDGTTLLTVTKSKSPHQEDTKQCDHIEIIDVQAGVTIFEKYIAQKDDICFPNISRFSSDNKHTFLVTQKHVLVISAVHNFRRGFFTLSETILLLLFKIYPDQTAKKLGDPHSYLRSVWNGLRPEEQDHLQSQYEFSLDV